MTRPATHRVTVDGLEMDLDDNGEIVRVWSEPAPSDDVTAELTFDPRDDGADGIGLVRGGSYVAAAVNQRIAARHVEEDVVTFGGVHVPAGPVSVRVSCAPTYATSHRWGWPDERGVMRCACGAKTGVLDGLACVVHSPAIAIERMGFLSQEERNTIASNFLDEEQEHLQGRWRIALGLGWIDHVPAPTEQERCERLGVEWAGPDVQDAPPWTPEEGYALGISSAEIEEAWNEYVGRHGLTVYRDPMRQEVVIDEIDAAEELRAELADDAENEQAFKLAHPGESCAWREHGNIVRLGCPEREVDGVTAR